MAGFLGPSCVASLLLCATLWAAVARPRGAWFFGSLLGLVFLAAGFVGATFLLWQAGLSALLLALLGNRSAIGTRRFAVAAVTGVVLVGVVLCVPPEISLT